MMQAAVLFGYAFVSNVAMAIVPHEPVVIWYGHRWGIWPTALVATAGTVVAAIVDHRLFASMVHRAASRPLLAGGSIGRVRAWFSRAPFAVIALSGLTPIPALPIKAVAFAERYPLLPYVAATGAGRLPRYLLLAWLGFVLVIPPWALVGLTILFLLPSLIRWCRHGNRTT